ncbi:hypothetical protein NM688_g8956 [Phlebia brevispora]|uniref:Uncharacterized protein n=1 Tax=Phlebia brevispora TaxID=194682 RepID=A0ACC1RN45_9APHY|nr:hypothetical protein NM688_g8956 [Phlebia brevispora]
MTVISVRPKAPFREKRKKAATLGKGAVGIGAGSTVGLELPSVPASAALTYTHSETMAPVPQCPAVASAMKSKGMSYKDIADKMGKDESFVMGLCTGAFRPASNDFNALAAALEMKDAPPHDAAHLTI